MRTEIDLLLLDIQCALLSAVSPALRAVFVDIDRKNDKQLFYYFYDAKVTDKLFDLASVATTEASCSLDYFTEEYITELKFPEKMPIKGHLAFLRKEPDAFQYVKEKNNFLEVEVPIARMLLLTQQALFGRITPALRAISLNIEVNQKKLSFYFIYDGEISKEDFELANVVIVEVAAFYPAFNVEKQIDRLDIPSKIIYKGERVAYKRCEDEDL